jgi:hypothetical protein
MKPAYYNEIEPYAAQWLRCAACGIDKAEADFSNDKSRPRGKKYSCKACSADAAKKRRSIDPTKHRTASKSYRERNLAKELVRGAMKRAKLKGIDFDLDDHIPDIERRIEAGYCEATGLPFQFGLGHHWASPSLDRLNATGPYLYSNIRIVLHGYNNAIGNWGEEVLFAMVDARRRRT